MLRAQPYLADARARRGAGHERHRARAVLDHRRHPADRRARHEGRQPDARQARERQRRGLRHGRGRAVAAGVRLPRWLVAAIHGLSHVRPAVPVRQPARASPLRRDRRGVAVASRCTRSCRGSRGPPAWRRSTAIRRSSGARTSTRSRSMSSAGAGELNAVYRIGGGANGLFAGAQVAGDRVSAGGRGVIITDTGFVDDPDTTLGSALRHADSHARRRDPRRARTCASSRPQGFDALEGAQDVANGMQAGGAGRPQRRSEQRRVVRAEARSMPARARRRSFVGHAGGRRDGPRRRRLERHDRRGAPGVVLASVEAPHAHREHRVLGRVEHVGAVPAPVRHGPRRCPRLRGLGDGGRTPRGRATRGAVGLPGHCRSTWGSAARRSSMRGRCGPATCRSAETVNPRVGGGVGSDLRGAALEPKEPARGSRGAADRRTTARTGA